MDSYKVGQESLYIKDFGPLKDVEINDFKRFTFFVGESGSGKSTILKVLAMMRHIYKQLNLRSYLKSGNIGKSFDINFNTYLSNGGMTGYVHSGTSLVYRRYHGASAVTEIMYTSKSGLEGTRKSIPLAYLSLEKIAFLSDQRGAIASLLAHNSDGAVLGFYFRETFLDFMHATEAIKQIDMPYLHIRYHEKKNGAGIRKFFIGNRDSYTPYDISFEAASSGIQTTTPLTLTIEYFSKYFDIVKSTNQSVVNLLVMNDRLASFRHDMNVGQVTTRLIHLFIEEPELSLYPRVQRSIVNMLVGKSQSAEVPVTLTIATHSPYIINHLNLLMKAYDKGLEIEGASLNYNDVGVYLVKDGQVIDLKVQNAHLINTECLSEDINDIYDTYDRLDEHKYD